MEMMRESVFISALRSFARAFFSLFGFFLALIVLMGLYALVASPHAAEENTTLKILPDLEGHRAMVSLQAPVILCIDVKGIVGDPESLDTEVIHNLLLDSQSGLLQGERVKAILLRINTPGGTVSDSDNIYRMLQRYKEVHHVPIFAYVEGMCCSGGMYIASAAERIYATPSSIIGSVGVLAGPFFNVVDTLQRYGVQTQTLTQGLDKDAMSPFRPWREGESSSLQAVLAYYYDQFVGIVTAARPQLSREKLVQEYGAHIFAAPQAKDFGYIDEANADEQMALSALLEEVKIDTTKPYQVVQLTPKRSFLADLVQGKNRLFQGEIRHTIALSGSRSFEIRDPCAYLYEP